MDDLNADFGEKELHEFEIGQVLLFKFSKNEKYPWPVTAKKFTNRKSSLHVEYFTQNSQGQLEV